MEAAATGNNVLAGAAAGAGSEAAADFIVKTLYKGKSTQDLTEAEKQNVTFLSQLAGGLASGLIGDSTQSAAVGADIGKRAVENNKVNKSQAGTVEGFERFFNNTRTKMGTLKNKDAEVALFRLNDIGLDLKPATTPPFNNMHDRYIYTEDGGWIDMAHFVFYAGDAYSEKVSLLEQREYLNNGIFQIIESKFVFPL